MFPAALPFRALNRPDNTILGSVTTAVTPINIPFPPQSGTFQVLVTADAANTGPVFIAGYAPPVPPATRPTAAVAVPTATVPGGAPVNPGSAQTFTLEPGTTTLLAIGGAAGKIWVTTGQGL